MSVWLVQLLVQQICQQNLSVIIKLVNLMKNSKSSSKIIRSKFFQRIKQDTRNCSDQNLNSFNCKSSQQMLAQQNRRESHSLEKKSPIKINLNNLCAQMDSRKSNKLLNCIKDQEKIDFYQQKSIINQKSKFKLKSKDQLNYDQLCEIHETKTNNSLPHELNLLQQNEILQILQHMWKSMTKIRQKKLFIEQTNRLQQTLKSMLLKIAKPKFSIFQQTSFVQYNFPSLKTSPFGNINSIKESKQCSTFELEQKHNQQSQNRQVKNSSELEYKKIMYILQDKTKSNHIIIQETDEEDQIMSNITQNNKQIQQNLSTVTLNVCKSNKQSSSFDENYSQSSNSQYTIFQQSKISNSRANDKMFFKNIVKKSNNICPYTITKNQIYQSSIYTDQSSPNIKASHPSLISGLQECNFNEKSKKSADIQLTQTLQTIPDESETKRATLNNIISMLNKKYNKNILIQGRT